VDEFGRVWFPDINLLRVRVIDTNGNAIAAFGSHGNAESAGPGSAVARAGIAFAWAVGVGVTDRYVHVGDSINRRMLRLRITYAAEKTCRVHRRRQCRERCPCNKPRGCRGWAAARVGRDLWNEAGHGRGARRLRPRWSPRP